MIFTIIGFLALVVGMCYATLICLMVCANSLGKWNIGGVYNTLTDKLIAIAAVVIDISAWYLLFKYMPFVATFSSV